MFPFRLEHADYKDRLGLMIGAGVLAVPDNASKRPAKILRQEMLHDLSFALFMGWLFDGLHNGEKAEKVRIVFTPATADGTLRTVR